ncbi:MAG: indolepyruvate oxidoreductase subunit beta [Eubacteriales bacterium]
MSVKNIMIVGVGGQGSLLASRVLGSVALSLGYDVKVSEVHGMSQRGGSVVTYVRYGDNVASPVICKGEADIILAFELLEAARWLPYLREGGKLYANTQKIIPMPVITGAAKYPENIEENISKLGIDAYFADALELAKSAGSSKAVNIVLIGMMAHGSEVDKQVFIEAIKSCVAPKFLDMNLKAFELGYNYTAVSK